MIDVIVALALLLIVGGAVVYIVKQKKRGTKCIGCPFAETCGGQCKEE